MQVEIRVAAEHDTLTVVVPYQAGCVEHALREAHDAALQRLKEQESGKL